MVITTLMVVRQQVETVGARQSVFRARQLAEMGIAVASHPGITAIDPLLRSKTSEWEAYEALISTEESRLPMRSLLSEQHSAHLERVLVGWGLTEMEAETLVDRLLDWADEDDFVRLKGAERKHYTDEGFQGRPYNRPLRSAGEVALVAGWERLVEVRPDWRDWITFHGSGRLDVNEAPAQLLAAFTGASLTNAEFLVRHRAGLDGLVHTEDDEPVATVEEALAMLGVSSEEAAALTPLLTVQGATKRIESIGRSGGYARAIVVVVTQDGARPQMLEWKEYVPQ